MMSSVDVLGMGRCCAVASLLSECLLASGSLHCRGKGHPYSQWPTAVHASPME